MINWENIASYIINKEMIPLVYKTVLQINDIKKAKGSSDKKEYKWLLSI